MLFRSLTRVAIVVVIALTTSVFVVAQDAPADPADPAGQDDPAATAEAPDAALVTGYADVNGLQLYYEIHGEDGHPLVMLHGGLGGIVDFSQLLPLFAQTRQVIVVELQAHGHTADIDRPMSFEAMADDVAALVEQLDLESVDVLGFSLGGGVALQTAIRHPEMVRKLVLISTAFRRDGWYPEVLAGMSGMNAEAAAMMLETPMYQFFASVAPDVETGWPALVGKVGDLMAQDYDWTEDVAALEMPVLVIVSDSDSVQPAHALELFQLLGGGIPGDFAPVLPASQLAIIPGAGHYGILFRGDLLLPVMTPFLDTPTP